MKVAANQTQVGGTHYTSSTVQPWEAMEAWMSPTEFSGFLRGNVIKYLARANKKGSPMQDLLKAQHYMNKLIEFEQGEQKKLEDTEASNQLSLVPLS